MRFKDRKDGGAQLAQSLLQYKDQPDTIVIGLPRGGVITAAEVAKKLNLPLDIMVPRKIGAPFNEELAVGAVTQDGDVVWNESILKTAHLEPSDLIDTIQKEKKESARRLLAYRGNKPILNLENKTVIIVDDGIATGATMRAAIASAKKQQAKKIVVATPVSTPETLQNIGQEVADVVSVLMPTAFLGISAFYESFPQTTDEEVIALLS